MHSSAVRVWFKRFIVTVMISAFVPAVIAAHACETTCAAMSEAAAQVSTEHSHSEGTSHNEHELPSSDHAGHLEHGDACHLASMVCAPPSNRPPLLAAYVDTWMQPIESAFVSFIWPPPFQPPRG